MTEAFSEEFREIRTWKVSLIPVVVQFLTRVATKVMNENFYNIINSRRGLFYRFYFNSSMGNKFIFFVM